MTRFLRLALAALVAVWLPCASVAQTIYQPPAADLSVPQRILRSAARGITPIETVMATPPTFTEGTAYSNSTIITSASSGGNSGGFRFPVTDPRYVDQIGGPFVSNGQYGQRAGTFLVTAGDTTRKGGNGWGIRFGTYSQTVDYDIAPGSQPYSIYITDMTTGIRARDQVNDHTPTVSASHYDKLDFGSRGWRVIEIYPGDGAQIFGGNVPLTDSIWAVKTSDVAKAAIIWDSYGQGSVTDTGTVNSRRLNVVGYLGERLGIKDIVSLSTGGTGVLATNAGANTTFQQRINNGDLDAARIGNLDLVFAPTSLNDGVVSNGGTASDATFQAAYTTYIASVMVAQPRAVIIGFGPEYSNNSPPAQSRYDAAKAGFLAAAGGDLRMIYLDSSPAGENWLFGSTTTGINQTMIGGDLLHPTRIGARYLGYRIADSAIAAIRARFGL